MIGNKHYVFIGQLIQNFRAFDFNRIHAIVSRPCNSSDGRDQQFLNPDNVAERILAEHEGEVTNSVRHTYVFRTFTDWMNTTKAEPKQNYLRIAAAIVIMLAAGYIIFRYQIHKREIPEHAHVIPSDVIAVLNLNLPALAEAYSERGSGGDSASTFFAGELKKIAGNDFTSSGIALNRDLILFMYKSGDAAYFGVSIALNDSSAFGKQIRNNKNIRFQSWNDRGFPVMRLDTTPAVIGWTENTALLVYPISNHGVAHTSVQCIELLKQKEDKSVLTNSNYCKFVLNEFDAALWIQPKSLLAFTDNADLFRQTFAGTDYVNYTFTFDEGNISGRSEWTLASSTRLGAPSEMPLPAEGSDVLGMIRYDLDFNDPSLYSSFVDSPPINALPLSDEEAATLLPYLTGECAMCLYDTIAYEYKTDTNGKSVTSIAERGISFSYVLRNADKANEILSTIMERDSVPRIENAWSYNENGSAMRMTIDGNLLSVSNAPQADGRRHEMPLFLKRKQFWFDIKNITRSPAPLGLLNWFLPSYADNHRVISEIFKQANGTTPAQLNNITWSTFEIEFTDSKTNALIQLEKFILRMR